jgi:hypothetical protein
VCKVGNAKRFPRQPKLPNPLRKQLMALRAQCRDHARNNLRRELIHLEASHRLAAMGGTEPDFDGIKRVRADEVGE